MKITRESLDVMAQKCDRFAEKQNGVPVVEEAADMLVEAAIHIDDLERRLDQWERAGARFKADIPSPREPREDMKPEYDFSKGERGKYAKKVSNLDPKVIDPKTVRRIREYMKDNPLPHGILATTKPPRKKKQ